MTIIHQDRWSEKLAPKRVVNFATESSAPSVEEMRESVRQFQSLIVWEKKLLSVLAKGGLKCQRVMLPDIPN